MKQIWLASLLILITYCQTMVFAADSTGLPFNSSTTATPTTVNASPFVLQHGYLDYTGTVSSNAYWYAAPSVGWCWSDITNSQNYHVCWNGFQTSRLCPTGFTNYVVVTPVKSETAGTSFSGLCVQNVVQNGSGYLVYILSNYLAGTGSSMSGVAIQYTMYCYPPGQSPPPYNSMDNCAPPSTVYTRRAILLWDMGLIGSPPNWASSAPTTTVTTNRACPAGYTPFATIVAAASPGQGNTVNTSDIDFSNSSGVCVNRIDNSGSGYQITYLTRNVSSRVTTSTNYLYIRDAYKWGNMQSITWVIYCYPPGVAPSHNYYIPGGGTVDPAGVCNTSTAPYN